jgi:hypothetical protein
MDTDTTRMEMRELRMGERSMEFIIQMELKTTGLNKWSLPETFNMIRGGTQQEEKLECMSWRHPRYPGYDINVIEFASIGITHLIWPVSSTT